MEEEEEEAAGGGCGGSHVTTKIRLTATVAAERRGGTSHLPGYTPGLLNITTNTTDTAIIPFSNS